MSNMEVWKRRLTAARKVVSSFVVQVVVHLPVTTWFFVPDIAAVQKHGAPALVGPVLATPALPRLGRNALYAAPRLPRHRLIGFLRIYADRDELATDSSLKYL